MSLRGAERRGNLVTKRLLRGVYPEGLEGLAMTGRIMILKEPWEIKDYY
jgi:hypothetical protein